MATPERDDTARRPGPPNPTALTVTCDAGHERALRRLLGSAEDVEDVGNAASMVDLERLMVTADIALVDAPSLGPHATPILDLLGCSRIRHVLVFSDEPQPGDKTAFAASILDDESTERLRAVGVRVSLLASRCFRRPRTLSSTSLRAAIAELQTTGANVRAAVRHTTETPLEVIAIFGGAGGRDAAEAALQSVSHVRVPTVVAVDDWPPLSVEALRGVTKAPVHPLDQSLMLKRLPRGILVAARPRGLFFESDSACISRFENRGIGGPIASVAKLGHAAAVVLLAGPDDSLCSSLGTAANAGVATFAVEPKADVASPAVESALKFGLAEPITLAELSWMIENAVPRRA